MILKQIRAFYPGVKLAARTFASYDSREKTEYDHLKVLKLNPGATEDEVKTQFRKLAFEYHPDSKKEGITAAEEKERLEKFLQIKDAQQFFEEKFHQTKPEPNQPDPEEPLVVSEEEKAANERVKQMILQQ